MDDRQRHAGKHPAPDEAFGSGGTEPIGEGPGVMATDEGIAYISHHPGAIPGTDPDQADHPGRGGRA